MVTPAERLRRLVDRRGAVQNRHVAAALRVSPATAHRLLQALVLGGVLQRHGKGRAAQYRLRALRRRFRRQGLDEHLVWQNVASEIARIRALDPDAARSLAYAASEIVNNAVDHSGGRTVEVGVAFEGGGTTVTTVQDDGIGVFRKVCDDFGYATPREAIVQLEKGKLTSDPSGRHERHHRIHGGTRTRRGGPAGVTRAPGGQRNELERVGYPDPDVAPTTSAMSSAICVPGSPTGTPATGVAASSSSTRS